MIARIALHYLGNWSDTEDMVQEVILKWIESAPVFKDEEHEKSWFIRVTIDQTGIPLERLHFQSIRQVTVDSKTQAVLLAIISDKTGIPADRLIIKSIKAID